MNINKDIIRKCNDWRFKFEDCFHGKERFEMQKMQTSRITFDRAKGMYSQIPTNFLTNDNNYDGMTLNSRMSLDT